MTLAVTVPPGATGAPEGEATASARRGQLDAIDEATLSACRAGDDAGYRLRGAGA